MPNNVQRERPSAYGDGPIDGGEWPCRARCTRARDGPCALGEVNQRAHTNNTRNDQFIFVLYPVELVYGRAHRRGQGHTRSHALWPSAMATRDMKINYCALSGLHLCADALHIHATPHITIPFSPSQASSPMRLHLFAAMTSMTNLCAAAR